MFARDHIYTVHENPDAADPCDRIALVREGFSFWAFVFTILWTLSNRLWLASAAYAAMVILIVKGGTLLGVDEVTRGLLQLGVQALLGFTAHDLQRLSLARRGYKEKSVVCATSELLAEQRYYDRARA